MNVSEFIEQFYRVISFGPGEPFPSAAFGALFRADALLLERAGEAWRAKSLAEYLAEMETAVRDYPALFAAGFRERPTGLDILEGEHCVLAASRYEKRYCRGGAPVVETGVNQMTLVRVGDSYRIAAVVW